MLLLSHMNCKSFRKKWFPSRLSCSFILTPWKEHHTPCLPLKSPSLPLPWILPVHSWGPETCRCWYWYSACPKRSWELGGRHHLSQERILSGWLALQGKLNQASSNSEHTILPLSSVSQKSNRVIDRPLTERQSLFCILYPWIWGGWWLLWLYSVVKMMLCDSQGQVIKCHEVPALLAGTLILGTWSHHVGCPRAQRPPLCEEAQTIWRSHT